MKQVNQEVTSCSYVTRSFKNKFSNDTLQDRLTCNVGVLGGPCGLAVGPRGLEELQLEYVGCVVARRGRLLLARVTLYFSAFT